MAWIKVINEKDAQGDLKDEYEKLAGKNGRVSNVMRVHSLHPPSITSHAKFYKDIMLEKEILSREQKELIALAVSTANQCRFCVASHVKQLEKVWGDQNKVAQFVSDPDGFPLGDLERKMVDYARKLTKAPHEMNENDVNQLRDAGLEDKQILLVNQVAAYFNYVNRSANGLGVEPN